uniref:Glucosidase II beta subunit N-terminal domain-containing protein n=1 Tax=Romanomermis culicivorax TaxID=13658 RepID=A0A915KES7_ROMCU
KPLYDPIGKSHFTCLDGSVSIPFEFVNDDYCDCKDGSDEPGTSACSNGKFHCPNLMHKAQDIPSSRVNDMVC